MVTVRGAGFAGAAPVRSVTFGGRPSPRVQAVSETELKALAPPGSGEADVRVLAAGGRASPVVPADRYGYDPVPEGPWLGLNGNSSHGLGPIDSFVEKGVLYDRSGPIEWTSGETLAQASTGLTASLDAGMIPVITIEFPGYEEGACVWGSDCLPHTEAAVESYVDGFVGSATELLHRYPAVPVLLEVINEPWGFGNAEQYAAILGRLLPAAAAAGLPLDRIYAAADGEGWVRALYRARPQLQTQVKGWYLHPYVRTAASGIGALPGIQAEMTSGQNNLIVSEIGFCAADVNGGAAACPSTAAPARTGPEAAADLRRELEAALPYHRAGWLRALLVYSRNDKGWAMQLEGGALTPSGSALAGFAEANP